MTVRAETFPETADVPRTTEASAGPETAVVLGAGMAGLAMAGALTAANYQVWVVDRDPIPDNVSHRSGVPQSRQVHNVLAGGETALGAVLPGIWDELDGKSGKTAIAEDMHVNVGGHYMPDTGLDLGLHYRSVLRPRIEAAARKVLQDRGVEFVGGQELKSFWLENDCVRGVWTRSTDRTGDRTAGWGCEASVVVDASGECSNTLAIIGESGYRPPMITREIVNQRFASLMFARPDGAGPDEMWLRLGAGRGGMIAPAAPGIWHANVTGRGADVMPQTIKKYYEFTDTLDADNPDGERLADLLRDAVPLSSRPVPYEVPRLATLHYGDWPLLPGLLFVGDRGQELNPVFGQGMTVAALQAEAFVALHAEHGDDTYRLTREHRRVSQAVAREAEGITDIITNPPLPEEGKPSIIEIAANDYDLYASFVRTLHLVEPSSLAGVLPRLAQD